MSEDLDIYRGQAKKLFENENSFLRNLEQSAGNSNFTRYLLTNATDYQVKCALFVIIFIFQKEIPLKKYVLSKIPKQSIENFLVYKNDIKSILLQSKETLTSILLGFEAVFPELVRPILHKDG